MGLRCIFKKDIVKELNSLIETAESLQEENQKLKQKLKRFDENTRVQLEITKTQDLENRLRQTRLKSFMMSDNEEILAQEFKDRHNKSCRGCSYSYTFHPTAIETFVEITCSSCKETIDLTNMAFKRSDYIAEVKRKLESNS